MQGTDLFIELAGIAGVFVGFGALIAVRSGGASDTFEVAYVRGVVSMGLVVVVAALAPVTIGRYDVGGHQVWAVSSVVFTVGWVGMIAANARTQEYWRAEDGIARSRSLNVIAALAIYPLMFASFAIPIVILLGLAPDLESALYFTTVVLCLIFDAWLLLQLVFRAPRPAGV
jgi:hypothetical protein